MARIKCPKCEWINEEGRATCSHCATALPHVRIQAVTPHSTPERRQQQMNQIQFRRGQIVAGRYTVLNMIGRGGMGCIYQVRDNALKEDVALKTLLPQFVRDKMVVERFFNEARIARALSHPNIVRVHDIGVTGDIIYISMEIIRGKSLRSILENQVEDHMPVKQALGIIDELCTALDYAHRHTVHRDIKPENVMVTDEGVVKLMDFGISKLMDSSRMTGTSIIMGTPLYMSPEQLKNSANVDARADIYSVGVMLYEIITGNMPTGLSKPASQITRDIPKALDAIVAKCVEPDPEKRFQSAMELREAIAPFLGESTQKANRRTRGVTAYAPPEESGGRPWGRRALGSLLIALIVALSASGFYTLELARKTQLAKAQQAAALPPDERTDESMIKDLDALHERLRARLVEKADHCRECAKVLEQADKTWAGVMAAAAPGNLEQARLALQAILGPLITPAGMVFVPPGPAMFGGALVPVEGFFIDETEVTVGDYQRFCEANNWPPPFDLVAVQPDMPICRVTFYDALAYAAWAGKSVPTEAQWARAALGDADIGYPWEENVWQDAAANTADGEDAHEYAAPVKSFALDLSWAGCYDMVGNVAEWTRSIFYELPYNPEDGREDLKAIHFGTPLVVRGSSYLDAEKDLQARANYPFEGALDALGFRCASSLPTTIEALEALAEQALAEK